MAINFIRADLPCSKETNEREESSAEMTDAIVIYASEKTRLNFLLTLLVGTFTLALMFAIF